MRSSVEPLEGNKVKLSIEVDAEEFDRALDAAFRKISREVRLPGFRPGKAPRRLIEARLGPQMARDEALRDALPDYYQQALEENDITPIAPPEIDITAGKEEGPVSFDAVVEVMPTVSPAGYEGLRIVLPNLEVTEADIDSQLDKLREQFGELQTVSRPARDGDHVLIDRKVTLHDEVVQAVESESYEVGKGGTLAPELDQELRGARAGDILKFNANLPQQGEVTFQVLVKEVRETVLPEVTDEWASEASEFETAAELREDIFRRMEAVKKLQAAMQVRDKVIEALVELVDEDMPEALVVGEVQRRVENLGHRLSHQGLTLTDYFEATGRSQEELVAEIQAESVAALKADLALTAVAEMEGIEVSDEEVEAEIEEMAKRRGEKPALLRRRLQSEGEMPAVRSGLRKTKALEWLVEHTEYVDEDGRVIDRADLEPRLPEAEEGSEAAQPDDAAHHPGATDGGDGGDDAEESP